MGVFVVEVGLFYFIEWCDFVGNYFGIQVNYVVFECFVYLLDVIVVVCIEIGCQVIFGVVGYCNCFCFIFEVEYWIDGFEEFFVC